MAKQNQSMNYQQELTDKIKENYISIAIGLLVFLVAVALIFRSNSETSQMDTDQDNTNQEVMMEDAGMYTVQAGDTISKISIAKFGTMEYADEIIELNNLANPDAIEVGMKLKLPAVAESADAEPTVADAQPTTAPTQVPVATGTTMEKGGAMTGKISITGGTYVVKQGDHLWSIAERAYGNGEKWTDIAKANNLRNADDIEVGMTLKLPR